MIEKPYSIKVKYITILSASFLMTAMITGLIISQVVLATDSSAPSKKESVPVGTVVSWAGQLKSIPKNWLLCDGKLLDNRKYQDLFKAIGTSWGGKGNKFNLPDLRGRFLRGVDAGSNRDPDRNKRKASRPGGSKTGLGSVQESAIQNHSHKNSPHVHDQYSPSAFNSIFYTTGTSSRLLPIGWGYLKQTYEIKSDVEDAVRFKTNSPLEVGEENRPVNAAVHWIIKVK